MRNNTRNTVNTIKMTGCLILIINLSLLGTIGYIVYKMVSDPSKTAESIGSFTKNIEDSFNKGYEPLPQDTTTLITTNP